MTRSARREGGSCSVTGRLDLLWDVVVPFGLLGAIVAVVAWLSLGDIL